MGNRYMLMLHANTPHHVDPQFFKNNLYQLFSILKSVLVKRTCRFLVQFVFHTFDGNPIVKLQN